VVKEAKVILISAKLPWLSALMIVIISADYLKSTKKHHNLRYESKKLKTGESLFIKRNSPVLLKFR